MRTLASRDTICRQLLSNVFTANSVRRAIGIAFVIAGSLCVTATHASAQDFDFPNFNSTSGLTIQADARTVGGIVRLTPAAGYMRGALWTSAQVDVAEGFESTFQFRITGLGRTSDPNLSWVAPGGDGFAFVIQNRGANAIGDYGEAMGYGGIPNSIAVEFDTWRNGYDPNDNHVSVHTRGNQPNSSDEAYSLAGSTAIPNLKDGNVHTGKIVYAPGVLQVYVDDALACTANINLSSDLGFAGKAWIGLTAATAAAWENHDILSWSYTIDTDGDGLPDAWEKRGWYVYDGEKVLLPGANWRHKDVYVHVDYMVARTAFGIELHSHKPDATAMGKVFDAFRTAPVCNPDGQPGVTLHIEMGREVPHVDQLGASSSKQDVQKALEEIKSASISAAVARSRHYCLFAHYAVGTSSGDSFAVPSTEFVISLGRVFWPLSALWVGTPTQQGGTFMHELGHNLGLSHGGGISDAVQANLAYKPNYLSVMNYLYQLSGLSRYGQTEVLDYSRFQLPNLDENNLDELTGLHGGSDFMQQLLYGYKMKWFDPSGNSQAARADGAIDWNHDGIPSAHLAANIHHEGNRTVLQGHDDWQHLVFNGGRFGAGEPLVPIAPSPQELDFDTAQTIPTFPPDDVTADFGHGHPRLVWSLVGAAGDYTYNVYRQKQDADPELIGTTEVGEFAGPSLVSGRVYTYFVTSVTSLGAQSGASNKVTLTPRNP